MKTIDYDENYEGFPHIKPIMVNGWRVINAAEGGDLCMGQFSREPTWYSPEESIFV